MPPVEESQRPSERLALWERLTLGLILTLSAFLNLFHIGETGYANTYYAATVRSMLMSWQNFFFASFDPGGFVTVDKPPLGFWIQALSAALLGFSGIALLLPQAVAGVLSVALLCHLVRRPFGAAAGLIAALVLAITPVAVTVNRDNTIDALLILTLLGAVWCMLRAIERDSLSWLLAGVLLVGLGFNIKMLQAYLVVPALYLAYLAGSRPPRRTRILHLVWASLVLLAVSLSWAVAVELTPADQRPYVGSSETNSVIELIVGYNGLLRLLPGDWSALFGAAANQTASALTSGGPGQMSGSPFGGETGEPGPWRLFNQQLAGQIAWLLPLAAVGLVAAWRQRPARWSLDRRRTSLLLWGI